MRKSRFRKMSSDLAPAIEVMSCAPRGAVKTAHLRALENRTQVGGHFRNRTRDMVRRGTAPPA
jgi:hypothetical protein